MRGGGGSNGRGSRDVVAHGAGQADVVEREVERLPGGLEPGHEPRRDVLGTLSAILQREHFDRIHGAAVWRVATREGR